MKFHVQIEKKYPDDSLIAFGGVFKLKDWQKAVNVILEIKKKIFKIDPFEHDPPG